jgi:predicted phosphodiesterase
VARALTAGACPSLNWQGGSAPMQTRAAPGVVPARAGSGQAVSKASVFPLRSCEAVIPPGAQALRVQDLPLPAPRAEIRRIVLLGDTGCRMKQSDAAFQDCHDATAWPFAQIARSAAALQPDLVVHLGDIHYRESPCPADRAGCAGSPWGYGHDAWAADFFLPAAPLLAAAPWLVVRGNHESCARAGHGWFRYLDGHGYTPELSCDDPSRDTQADYTEPYAVPLDAQTQWIVFDSAAVSGKAYGPNDPAYARYLRLIDLAGQLTGQRPLSIWLNHHPVLAFGSSASGAPKSGTAGLLSVLQARHPERLFPNGVDLVINGHVHLFEALDFAGPHPAELLVGNGGSAMEGHVDAGQARSAQPAAGARVRHFATQPGYGFATLDRSVDGWELTERGVDGSPLLRCELQAPRLVCRSPN